jgi:hypothetical protein
MRVIHLNQQRREEKYQDRRKRDTTTRISNDNISSEVLVRSVFLGLISYALCSENVIFECIAFFDIEKNKQLICNNFHTHCGGWKFE